ncbi:MAG: DUF1475 family protein [Candidatus Omnitrophica bacterium]|nr:DUF1475 family protein [Candidatus Omnitrophota bacterium]
MNHVQTINSLKVIFASISVFMVYLVIVTSMKSDMFHLPTGVLHEPWFTTTLVDFYFNIFIISSWVVYRERNLLASVLWIIAFICLGSIATAFYVFIQLMGLKDKDGFENVLVRKA